MSTALRLIKDNKGLEPPTSPIKDIERLAMATPGALSLAQGNAPFAPPPEIVEAVSKGLHDASSWLYTPPEGLRSLREAIARDVAHDGTSYAADREVIVTCGATEALASALLTILEPDDELLVPTPAYVSFKAAASLARARIVSVPMTNEDDAFRLDFDALKRAATARTRARSSPSSSHARRAVAMSSARIRSSR